ncbi:hypothetical protein [Actinomycetospora aeridis]|uniref:Uncharacterized protein n=1 Tax=Actinomycetospora aeridis TaxID=3129231 RepID=A0ABU8N361_9PSEU
MAVLLVIKWLVITASLLAVPFGIWWAIDRSRRRAPVLAIAPPMPAPPVPIRPARPPAPRRPAATGRPAEPPTTPIPVPRAAAAAPVLDADREVVVTREEDHQDVLAGLHRPGAAPRPVTVELWSSTVTRGKYRGDYAVEVRIDGRRVGELTAAMSARYRHLVDVIGPVRCRGVVTHGARGFQVDLKLPEVV